MRLATDGDPAERRYWAAFVAERFPSYEAFWLAHVEPLTGRRLDPPHVHFRSQTDLGADRDEEVTIAQLHFTTLLHLGRVYDLLHPPTPPASPDFPPTRWMIEPGPGSATITAASAASSEAMIYPTDAGFYARRPESEPDFDMHAFTEAFVHLAAASDVADELLQRHACPGHYGAWKEGEGALARRDWRKTHDDPLKRIRAYRNRLVHGRVVPSVVGWQRRRYPRIDKVDDYLDWRKAIGASRQAIAEDFDDGFAIVSQAWDETVDYVEARWRLHLLVEGGSDS